MKHIKNLWELMLYLLFGTPQNRRDTFWVLISTVPPAVYLLMQCAPSTRLRIIACWGLLLALAVQFLKKMWGG